MATSNSTRETFDDSESRHDEMHSTIETWLEDLVCEVDDAVSSDQFREWLESRVSSTTTLLEIHC